MVFATQFGPGTAGVNFGANYFNPSFSSSGSPTLTQEQMNAISQSTFNRINGTNEGVSAWEHIGRFSTGVMIDLADTVYSSPLNPMDTKRGDVWAAVSPEQRDYYERNKGMIEGTSAVVGGLATAIAAEAVIIPRLAAGIAASGALEGTMLMRATRGWNEATRVGLLNAQRAAAEGGETFGLLSSSAGRAYMTNRVAAGVANVTRTMPLEYGVMWNNEAFNSGDWATEGFWITAGAVLGGSLGAISGRAVNRRIANSPEIRELRAAPLTLSGVSNDLLSDEALDWAPKVHLPDVQLKESANFTEYALASRSADPNGMEEAAANATRLHSLRGTYTQEMFDSGQKMLTKGIAGVSTVRNQLGKIPELRNVVDNLIKDDPFVLHGVAEIGILPGSYQAARAERDAYIDSLRKGVEIANMRGLTKEAQRLAHEQRVLKTRDDFVLIDGAWVAPESELGKAVIDFDPAWADKLIMDNRLQTTADANIVRLPGIDLRFDAGLTPTNLKGTPIDVQKLSIEQRLYLTHMTRNTINHMAKNPTKIGFKLTPKTAGNWFTLDAAAEVMKRGGKVEFDGALTGLNSLEAIQRESLRIKAGALLNEIGTLGKITPELRFKYNLPMATPMEALEDSAGDMFREWLKTAASPKFTAREMSQALADMREIQGVSIKMREGQPLPRLDGDMYSFNRSKAKDEGKDSWLRPLLGYFDRKSNIQRLAEGAHSMAVTQYKAERTAVLMRAGDHVGELTRNLTQRPTMRVAMDIAGMANDQVSGLGGAVGQAASEFLPKRFIARDQPQILAAADLQETVERHGRAVFESLVKQHGMGDVITQITSSGHGAQRLMLDQYFSLRPGWDIEDIVPMADGKFGFQLADTASNRYRLRMGENEKWTKPLMANERTNQPIVVDEMGKSAIEAFNKITDSLIMADNTLRRAEGLDMVKPKKFYAPVQDSKNAHVGFVYGPDDKQIPGRTIVAGSEDEYVKLSKRTLDELGDGHTIRTRDHLRRMRNIHDEAQMDWIDPGISAATAGIGSQTGGLTGAYIRQGAFNEALEWVQRKTQAQAQDTLRSLMKEPLLVARANAVAETTLGTAGKRNVYDVYEHMLTGRSQRYDETSILDQTFRKVEKSIDKVLANSAISIPARHIMDLAERIGMSPADLNGKKTFESIAKELGPHMPFKNVTEYIESRGTRMPPTVKGMATKLNSLAATVFLRYLELPHALMNGLGLIAAMPATIMGGRAPISSFVNIKGDRVGLVDGKQIIANSMRRMFNRTDSNKDWQHMLKNGDATQSVIEYHQQLGSIQSQAGFMKWFGEADKWLSIASEKSEAWSRQVSHFVGLELADLHGIKGMEARHAFAREVANSMIADYAPINRPELFGSGFGSLIGLFQSYALNHYTKMFRWMEDGQYAKAGLQAAMQATMFGLPGTYGFGTLLDIRDSMTATGNEPTALDIMYSRFGPVLGGAIAHGSISELTGLALWTRGDMTPRIPGMSGGLPAIELGRKVANGFMDGVSTFLSAQPGETSHQLLESVQRNMPSRVLKSWLILANGGQEIDAYGQVMSDTQGWLDITARTLGLRSKRQQAELEAFYAGKSATERDAARMDRVRQSFRAAVRNANGDMEKLNPIQYYNDYVEAGGNPKSFKTFVRNNLRDADSPRSVQTLKGSMQTQKSALETWRYGAYGAWSVE